MSLEELSNNLGDWPRICDIWQNTFEERQSELNTTISTFDYIKKYPGLQGIQAVELVTIDLKIKHPEATSVEEWISTFPKIISKGKDDLKVDSENGSLWLLLVWQASQPDWENVLLLKLSCW